MIKAFICALALTLAPLTAALAEPAVWVVKDADSTIYLLGTVHVLRPQTVWETPRLRAMLASCKDLTLEIADVDDAQAVGPFVQAYGFDPAHRLSDRLKPKERQTLAAAARSAGIDEAALERMRPWLAAVTLSVAPITHAGYDPEAGVERIIKADAQTRGEPVKGFETTGQQVRLLADLPEPLQMELLRESLDEFDKAPKMLDKLAGAWAAGRTGEIDRYVNDDMRKESPGLYRTILVDRNVAFAAKIKAMLAGSGVSCVAVGAGHLAGPDSVQAQLRRLGIVAVRG